MCHSITTSTTASSPILSLHDVVCYFCNIDEGNVNAASNFTNLGRSIELYLAQDVFHQLRETLCDGKESGCDSDTSLECITCIAQLLMNKHLPPPLSCVTQSAVFLKPPVVKTSKYTLHTLMMTPWKHLKWDFIRFQKLVLSDMVVPCSTRAPSTTYGSANYKTGLEGL